MRPAFAVRDVRKQPKVRKFMYSAYGLALECVLFSLVFDTLGLEKLNCEDVETNESVLNLRKKYGFTEDGLKRANIVLNRVRIWLFFLVITKTDWAKQKNHVFAKLPVVEKFDIEIEHERASFGF